MKCSCPYGENDVTLFLHIDADLSCTGEEKWKHIGIDMCIAPFVKALQDAGINMRGSCCCHGKGPMQIDLGDGRMILIHAAARKAKGE